LGFIVSGRRAKVRLPDLIVLSEDGYAAMTGQRSYTITQEMSVPVLVVEVVSRGQENRESPEVTLRERDYRYKRTEYAARGINEYWIIDPEMRQITICLWVDGQYEDKIFTGDMAILSTVVDGFALTAEQVLTFGQ
jgi:Uma2 family endonuclease